MHRTALAARLRRDLSLPAAQEDELKTTLGELEADTPIEAGKVRKVLIKALGLVGKLAKRSSP
jgi:hypothetical protein